MLSPGDRGVGARQVARLHVTQRQPAPQRGVLLPAHVATVLGQPRRGLVELALGDQHLNERRRCAGRDRTRCAPIVGDAGEHPARGIPLPGGGVGPCGLEPETRALRVRASLRDQLERPARGQSRFASGPEPELVEQPAQRLERLGAVLGQRALQGLEGAQRIAPARAQVRLQPPRREIRLPLELPEERGPNRIRRLAQRAHGRDAVARQAADGGQPFPERAGEVAVGRGELRQLGRERIRLMEPFAAP